MASVLYICDETGERREFPFRATETPPEDFEQDLWVLQDWPGLEYPSAAATIHTVRATRHWKRAGKKTENGSKR